MAKKFIELQETENLLKRIGAPAYAIHALCLAPSYEAVHRAAYDQCAWERDLAIEQLRNDYGVGLGEKKSADVVEVVHGRWVEVHRTPFGSSAYRCSVCEGYMPFYNGYNYCPNCGAKMDGGSDEN